MKNGFSRRRVRLENARHRVSGLRTGGAQSRGKKNPGKGDEHPGDSPHDACPVSSVFYCHRESLMLWHYRVATTFSTDTNSVAAGASRVPIKLPYTRNLCPLARGASAGIRHTELGHERGSRQLVDVVFKRR